jgi:TPP-dependent pyruvate/acetoin dehydrogenase alpha subunit
MTPASIDRATKFEAWMRRDPIVLFSNYLSDRGLITEQDDEQIQSKARMRVRESVEFALSSAHSELIDAYTGVFASDR